MNNKNIYTVQKGDTLWDLSRQFFGSPNQWRRIYSHNNQDDVVKVTGKAIKDPDLIFPGQKIMIPMLPGQPKAPKKVVFNESRPASLRKQIVNTFQPHALAYKLEDLPVLVYVSPTVPGFTAKIYLQGDIAIRLADMVPLSTVTNKGLQMVFKQMSDEVLHKLVQESSVDWDPATNKIELNCSLVSHSDTPFAPSTSIGINIASVKPVPVLRGEILYPELKGYYDRNFFMAMNVKVVIDIEPRPGDIKGPEVVKMEEIETERFLIKKQATHPVHSDQDVDGWDLAFKGVGFIGAAILTDFLVAGILDDALLIPIGLKMIVRGLKYIIFPTIATATIASAATTPKRITDLNGLSSLDTSVKSTIRCHGLK